MSWFRDASIRTQTRAFLNNGFLVYLKRYRIGRYGNVLSRARAATLCLVQQIKPKRSSPSQELDEFSS